MIGIYGIRNIKTNEYYIGQSMDIEQRFKEHLYHGDSYIDNCIREFGQELFSFEILEECIPELLDSREEFYIQKFKSTGLLGYNLIKGGQHNNGESNPNAKLTEQDVYNIRESYKNHENKFEVYERYKK